MPLSQKGAFLGSDEKAYIKYVNSQLHRVCLYCIDSIVRESTNVSDNDGQSHDCADKWVALMEGLSKTINNEDKNQFTLKLLEVATLVSFVRKVTPEKLQDHKLCFDISNSLEYISKFPEFEGDKIQSVLLELTSLIKTINESSLDKFRTRVIDIVSHAVYFEFWGAICAYETEQVHPDAPMEFLQTSETAEVDQDSQGLDLSASDNLYSTPLTPEVSQSDDSTSVGSFNMMEDEGVVRSKLSVDLKDIHVTDGANTNNPSTKHSMAMRKRKRKRKAVIEDVSDFDTDFSDTTEHGSVTDGAGPSKTNNPSTKHSMAMRKRKRKRKGKAVIEDVSDFDTDFSDTTEHGSVTDGAGPSKTNNPSTKHSMATRKRNRKENVSDNSSVIESTIDFSDCAGPSKTSNPSTMTNRKEKRKAVTEKVEGVNTAKKTAEIESYGDSGSEVGSLKKRINRRQTSPVRQYSDNPQWTTDDESASSSAEKTRKKRVIWTDGEPRKKRVFWTDEETDVLLDGIEQHGMGRWEEILRDSNFKFRPCRSAQNLKDRYRSYLKQQEKLAKQRKLLEKF